MLSRYSHRAIHRRDLAEPSEPSAEPLTPPPAGDNVPLTWRSWMRKGRFLLGTLLFLLAALPAAAQTTTGVISGRVVDPTGLGIAGATVVLINEATSASRQTLSLESGDFVFPSILPGRYTVTVQAAG